MSIIDKYLEGLIAKYEKATDEENKYALKNFRELAEGASEESVAKLLEVYPDTPKSLIELLKKVDGTYHRKYEKGKLCFLILGSDIEEYPYYLLSSEQIVETKHEAVEFYGDYINGEYGDDVPVDKKLTDDSKKMNWLHFSDCMNNGGTSQLFIDFSPSPQGKKGQIVRFLHDPDEIEVIADSFDEYLQDLMDYDYDFVVDYE